VADVVNAISRKKVEEHVALRRVKFRARAERVIGLHPEQIEEPHPLRVDVVYIVLNCRRSLSI
jgi:hypothetical protein